MNDVKQAMKFREAEEHATSERAALLGLQYFDTREYAKTAALIQDLIPKEEMYKGRLVPLKLDANEGESLVFGITSSTPQSTLREIRERFTSQGRGVMFVMISAQGFREFMRRYDPPKEVVYDDVRIAEEGDSDTLAQVSQTLETVRSDDILVYLIEQADKLGASDIHIECQRTEVRIRMRVDGVLHTVAHITHDKYRPLQASIATKANISTASREAQTGHMQHEVPDGTGGARLLNMRIETIPTVYGQDAVVRLFNFDESLLNMAQLGLEEKERAEIEDIVSHPHGMVMVVGPTGSGKSTTLYSILSALNQPSRKIITLEDPVEYTIPGIVQIPVDTGGGDSFAEKLRAVMRLDPDVMMVGEIRDADTAKTAIQASITGHLVLSTFHADTAAAAFSRIVDMIGQNPIFSSAIRLVIGQRLVRRLDDATRIPYQPDDATVRWIKEVLHDLPGHVPQPDLTDITLYKPGTSADVPFGYKGRLLIMEQMVVSPRIQRFLRGSLNEVNADDIEAAAREDGMLSLLQKGVLLALKGETTLEEINKAI